MHTSRLCGVGDTLTLGISLKLSPRSSDGGSLESAQTLDVEMSLWLGRVSVSHLPTALRSARCSNSVAWEALDDSVSASSLSDFCNASNIWLIFAHFNADRDRVFARLVLDRHCSL
jgi:hypothetical protein